jgi:hypothetical protein
MQPETEWPWQRCGTDRNEKTGVARYPVLSASPNNLIVSLSQGKVPVESLAKDEVC